MLEKICLVCEISFFAKHLRQTLCSEICVKERRRQHSLKYKRKLAQQRELRIRARCIICDKKYRKKVKHQLTCSKICSYQNSINLANEWSKQALAQDPTFNKKKRFKRIISKTIKTEAKYCKICRKLISKSIGTTKTCSIKCRIINNKEISRQADIKKKWKQKFEKWWNENKDELLLKNRECLICKKVFRFTTNQKTCSYKCFKELGKQRHAIKYEQVRKEQIKRKLEWLKDNRDKFNEYRRNLRKRKKLLATKQN